jgi:uncharacterized protein YciI
MNDGIQLFDPADAPFVLILVVRKDRPREEVAKFTQAHIEYLERNHGDGVFLLSGETPDKSSGVIVAWSHDLAALERIGNEDPYLAPEVVVHEATTIILRRASSDLVVNPVKPDL